jgi:molybdopterin-guanine dinucleotide biosynthesis protein A
MPGGGRPIGVILAGGEGRRIGGAKATVRLAGRPLIAYPLEVLRETVGEVAVVAKADTELPPLPGIAVWIETAAPRHPLIGLIEALELAGGRPVVACAVDLPLITAEIVRQLLTHQRGDRPAVIAGQGGSLQPLLGLYAPEAAPRLRQAWIRQEMPLREVVAAISPAILEVPDEQVLFNVNAPEDVLRASALLDARRGAVRPAPPAPLNRT